MRFRGSTINLSVATCCCHKSMMLPRSPSCWHTCTSLDSHSPCCTGLAPNLILVVNPAVQYMAYEWLTQRHTASKQRRMGSTGAGGSQRVKLTPGEVFLMGKGSAMVLLSVDLWHGVRHPIAWCRTLPRNATGVHVKPAQQQLCTHSASTCC